MMNLTPKITGQKPRKTGILIISEDSGANFKYLNDKVASCRPNAANVFPLLKNSTDAGGPQPTKIVDYAIQKLKAENLIYKNGEAENDDAFYKEVYCIVDVDDNVSNGTLNRALSSIAQENAANPAIKFHLIISNECFEVWYILHFQDITEPLYREKSAEKGNIRADKTNNIEFLQKRQVGVKNKKFQDYFDLMKRIGDEAKAIERARNLQEKSKTSNPCENPSTDMHILITRLNSFKTRLDWKVGSSARPMNSAITDD